MQQQSPITCPHCGTVTTVELDQGEVYALHDRPDGASCLMSGTLVQQEPKPTPGHQDKAPPTFFALGPNCWGVGATAKAARRQASKFTNCKLGRIGVYRLPPGATASVDGLGRIDIEGGDGTTPVHVLGPLTVDWPTPPKSTPAPAARHGLSTFEPRKLDGLALGSLTRAVELAHIVAGQAGDGCSLGSTAPTGHALAVKAFGAWYPAKLVRIKSTGSLVVECLTGKARNARHKTVKCSPQGFDIDMLRWLAVAS